MRNILIALLIVLIILFVFNKPICKAVSKARVRLGIDEEPVGAEGYTGGLGAPTGIPDVLKDLSKRAGEQGKPGNVENYPATGSAVKDYRQSLEGLTSRRKIEYLNDGDWNQWISEDELDPSIPKNHKEFTENIQRFYTGASFTSVDEDNRDVFSTNFVGLRRPKATEIGASVRQIQDTDFDTLKRNKRFLL